VHHRPISTGTPPDFSVLPRPAASGYDKTVRTLLLLDFDFIKAFHAVREEKKVTSATGLHVKLANGGGAAVHIRPAQ
jgi:hypothetical protein